MGESESRNGYYCLEPCDEIRQLRTELKKLKDYKDVVLDLAKRQIIYLTDEHRMPKLYENAKDLKIEELEKALGEIEKELIKFCSDCNGKEDNTCEKGCYYSLIPTFKNIINKTKGGK